MAAQFHQAHGLLQAQMLDALANAFFGDEGLRGFAVRPGLTGATSQGQHADWDGV